MEERFCAHHADAGVTTLAAVLGRTPRDVILHMGAIGVDVSPIPRLGETCPVCGRRMPVMGMGLRSGICDACHTLRMLEARRRPE